MQNIEALREERHNRLRNAIALETPDRVPVMPKMNFFYSEGYGISAFESMADQRNIIPGLKKYLTEYEPDGVWGAAQYPIGALEALDPTFIRWPGAKYHMDLHGTFQIVDETYMEEDEYEEFCFDPTAFILSKWLPRRCSALSGLSKINIENYFEYSMFSGLAKFADPEVRQALDVLQRAGLACQDWLQGKQEFIHTVHAMGFPMGPALGQPCPFDMLADAYRGVVNAICDIKERPEELLQALDVMTEIAIRQGVGNAKALGSEYLFMPLHMGVDEFMSCSDYEKFYWPGLRKVMMAAIDAGITPFVFFEGNYNSRLSIISDIPKGKAVYMFEKVDMKRVKETVGKTACICGNVSTVDLLFGTPEKIEAQVKRLLDDCAAGGGFIMDCSIPIDKAKPENLHTFFDVTREYGRY